MQAGVGQCRTVSRWHSAASRGFLGSAGSRSGSTGCKSSGTLKAGAQAQWEQPPAPHRQNTSREQKQRGFCFPVGLLCWVLRASRTPRRSMPFSQSKVTPIPFLCCDVSGNHTSGRVHGNAPERPLRRSPPAAQAARQMCVWRVSSSPSSLLAADPCPAPAPAPAPGCGP